MHSRAGAWEREISVVVCSVPGKTNTERYS